MKKIVQLGSGVAAVLLFLSACEKNAGPLGLKTPDLPEQPYKYTEAMQTNLGRIGVFAQPNIDIFPGTFISNPNNPVVTDAGATLGRVLFYDGQLSLNNSVSCATCHKQELAFSDNSAGSIGFGGKITPRNSMAITNPVVNNNLFWDSRSNSVLDLVARPIQNHIEMGMEDMQTLAKKLSRVEYYKPLFEKAYGTSEVTEDRISNALAQFVCSMTTANSRFDRGLENNFAEFTTLEKMGQDLFFSARAKCSSCHSGNNFAAADFPGGEYSAPTVQGAVNIGLDLVTRDPGKNDGAFRIPSLRNIALTAPYMHDGRFKSLSEVIEHYNRGIAAHPGLDKKLKNPDGSPVRLGLNTLEKQALIAFLNTLTDEGYTRDPKFSDPF